jgi:hypothetical protein
LIAYGEPAVVILDGGVPSREHEFYWRGAPIKSVTQMLAELSGCSSCGGFDPVMIPGRMNISASPDKWQMEETHGA